MATITIGGNDYGSFQDVAGADIYLAGDISRSESWALLNTDAKGRALISATRMMQGLPWCETPPDPEDEQAEPIPSVAAKLAADLAANPKLFADATGNSNIKSAKAGSAMVEFFSPVDGGPPIPRALWDELLRANLVCLGTDADENAAAIPFGTCSGYRPLDGRWPWDWPIAREDYD